MRIGIDIGGTKTALIFWKEKEKKERLEFVTADYSPLEFLEILSQKIEQTTIKFNWNNPEVIGISCGGPLDSIEGIIQNPPNLPGWDNIEIVKILQERFHCPVFIENDANACALAEWIYGAGRGSSNMVFLTFGTGLGAGLILDRKLYRGTNNNAGEVGHIRLESEGPVGYNKKGSFEGFCSGGGITRLAQIMGKQSGFELPENLTTKEIFARARSGEKFFKKVLDRTAQKLGMGLSILIDILNPEKIVIGSIYARGHELLDCEMYRVLEEEALSNSREVCSIVPAELGEEVGDFATLAVIEFNTGLI